VSVKDYNPEAGDPDNWESAKLNVKRPTSAIVSVRMPTELVVSLEAYARARSETLSDAVRLAAERLIRSVEQTPTFAVLATAKFELKLAGPTVLMHAVTLGTQPIELQKDSSPYHSMGVH
jgi:predicted DNA-binding protein